MNYVDYLFVFFMFLLFAASFYFMQRAQIKNEQQKEIDRLTEEKQKLENRLKLKDKDLIIPMRMQAYERLMLLMERINPQSMIFRIQKPGMNALQLQTQLLQSIRAEFEHNLAQQLYITPEAWAMVKNAKENLTQLINTAASKVQPESQATELSKEIFALQSAQQKTPIDSAILVMKNEIQKMF
jgi:cbb3-type cytochrome oxidase subunit 3